MTRDMLSEAREIADFLRQYERVEAQDVAVGDTVFISESGVPSNRGFTVEKVRAGFTGEVCLTHSFKNYDGKTLVVTDHFPESYTFFRLNENASN